ncbi:sensor histidine kinase [Rhizobium sp. BK376]|uniref:sensor histidine kinase n=1 Tax=Rhizobium sp. BK376 TaxID=2512149 RepID=UPI001046C43D|nr:sensor histidine kinase [Rhizobium sp. BK376]TCR85293.1 two-component system sensor histidine kinase TctE [Rhizobium sp. BK376]
MPRLLSRGGLRLNLLLWVMIPIAGLLALSLWLSFGAARRQATLLNEQRLLSSARVIAEQVRYDAGRIRAVVPPAALELFDSGGHDEVAYRVETLDGHLIVGFPELPLPAGPIRDFEYRFYPASFRDETMTAVAFRQPIATPTGSTPVLVLIGSTLNSSKAMETQLWFSGFVEQSAVVLLTAVLIWIGISRELRPLLALREAVLARTSSQLEPFDANAIQYELRPLVEAINSHMARLLDVVGRQRRFLDAAAHQLRTPLAVMKMQVAYAVRTRDEKELREALNAVGSDLESMSRMTLQLLALARVENIRALPPQMVDLRAVAREIVAGAVPRALDHEVDLGLEAASPSWAMIRERLLRELLTNLVDNVIAHAGRGASAVLRIEREDDQVTLSVEDDGRGPGMDDLSILTSRFQRGGNSTNSGSGLGLSIVAEIVDICDGSLHLYHPAGGRGFGVAVRLPAAPQDEVARQSTGSVSPDRQSGS